MTPRKLLLILLVGLTSGGAIFGQTQSSMIEPLQENKQRTLGESFIEVQTTVNSRYIRGNCERAGFMRFLVHPTDMPEANPQAPLYIRVQLTLNAKLCETLVWRHESNQDPLTSLPIFLPMRAAFDAPANAVVAPTDTMSIVRWKKGEDQIWLKVQRSPSFWVQNGYEGTVSWSLGISARTSWEQNRDTFANGLANLPSATRFPMDLDQNSAVSTLLCLDLRQSTLEPHIPGVTEGLVSIPGLFDIQTQAVEDALTSDLIVPGLSIENAFSGDGLIAIGFDLTCFREQTPPPEPQILSLCPENRDPNTSGLVKLSSGSRQIEVDCNPDFGPYPGSKLQLRTQPGASYGFRVLTNKEGDPMISSEDPSKVLLDPDSIVFLNQPQSPPIGSLENLVQIPTGEYLCSDAESAYLGLGDSGVEIGFTCSVWGRIGGPTDQIRIQQAFLSIFLDPSFIIDTAPFDGHNDAEGTDQWRDCQSSFIQEAFDDWYIGEFLACDLCECAGDLNCDFQIDLTDLHLLLNQVFMKGDLGDLNGDMSVDIRDLIILTNAIGSCLR